jgi:hypothetical protein
MQPYFELNESTSHIIFELLNKCLELDLGNVSFHYYPTPGKDEVDFYITEYKNHWEVVVKNRRSKTTDIYRIIDGVIIYQYSEKD